MAQSLSRANLSSAEPDTVLSLMDKLTMRAMSVDHDQTDLQEDIDLLHAHGWLFACVPKMAGGMGFTYQAASLDLAIDFMFRLGGANLALGRLFEGHANACKLVHMLAAPDQANRVWAHVSNGAFLGVWGADGAEPVALKFIGDALHLNGKKAFCSGLGRVGLAIISATSPNGLQLILADVSDHTRNDPTTWRLTGMQATRSGTYDFNKFPAARFSLLGKPDAYYGEPHFLGGQWRYLALHAGCVCAIAQAVSAHLNELGRLPSDGEYMRLARIVALSKQAQLWATSIAFDTEIATNPDAGIQAIIGRELVEQACLEAIALAERTIGTRAFQRGTRIEQLCRDLRTYLRQAALDQRLIAAGQKLLALSPTGQTFMNQCGATTTATNA